MKIHIPLAILWLASMCSAENATVQTPPAMEQLMRELQIQGGNVPQLRYAR